MTEVPSRELRNDTRGVLRRVEAGDEVVITVDGKPVAVLMPIGHRRRWVPRDAFFQMLEGHQADPGLRDVLRELASDTTDDLGFR